MQVKLLSRRRENEAVREGGRGKDREANREANRETVGETEGDSLRVCLFENRLVGHARFQ